MKYSIFLLYNRLRPLQSRQIIQDKGAKTHMIESEVDKARWGGGRVVLEKQLAQLTKNGFALVTDKITLYHFCIITLPLPWAAYSNA